jgi:hypothetical protein
VLWMRPYTGRTHQLRVAAKSVGLPLAGDAIYRDRYASTHPLTTLHLHATALHWPAGNLTLVCPPRFFAANDDNDTTHGTDNNSLPSQNNPANDTGVDAAAMERTFQALLCDIIEKHCDCEPILQAMRASRAAHSTTTTTPANTTSATTTTDTNTTTTDV